MARWAGHAKRRSRQRARWRVALAPALMLALAAIDAGAAAERMSESAATGFIDDLASRAAQTLAQPGSLSEREAALRALLRGGFEIPLIARIALGKHWRGLSEEERAAFVELFGEYLLRTYASRLAAFERERFEVVGAVPRGKRDMLVQTRILQDGGPPVKAGWRVRLFEGQPRIIDIVVEGVSMAINQRQEFQGVLAREGMSGLLEMLRARAQALPVEGPEGARRSY